MNVLSCKNTQKSQILTESVPQTLYYQADASMTKHKPDHLELLRNGIVEANSDTTISNEDVLKGRLPNMVMRGYLEELLLSDDIGPYYTIASGSIDSDDVSRSGIAEITHYERPEVIVGTSDFTDEDYPDEPSVRNTLCGRNTAYISKKIEEYKRTLETLWYYYGLDSKASLAISFVNMEASLLAIAMDSSGALNSVQYRGSLGRSIRYCTVSSDTTVPIESGDGFGFIRMDRISFYDPPSIKNAEDPDRVVDDLIRLVENGDGDGIDSVFFDIPVYKDGLAGLLLSDRYDEWVPGTVTVDSLFSTHGSVLLPPPWVYDNIIVPQSEWIANMERRLGYIKWLQSTRLGVGYIDKELIGIDQCQCPIFIRLFTYCKDASCSQDIIFTLPIDPNSPLMPSQVNDVKAALSAFFTQWKGSDPNLSFKVEVLGMDGIPIRNEWKHQR